MEDDEPGLAKQVKKNLIGTVRENEVEIEYQALIVARSRACRSLLNLRQVKSG